METLLRRGIDSTGVGGPYVTEKKTNIYRRQTIPGGKKNARVPDDSDTCQVCQAHVHQNAYTNNVSSVRRRFLVGRTDGKRSTYLFRLTVIKKKKT